MNTISVNKQVQINRNYDVIVVGGGPAGTAAAFAASRQGMKTLIIEQFNCLGGIATAGGHGHICLYSAYGQVNTQVVGGIPFEIAQRVVSSGFGKLAYRASVDFEVEGMKLVLEQMAEECGCEVLYYSFFSDCVVENNEIKAVLVQNKDGMQAFSAKYYIDCTGDGDVAARAGCGFDVGEENTGSCQPMTLMFTIGGVDYEKVKAFRTDYKLEQVWKKAQGNGDMRPFQSCIMGWWWTPTRPDQLGVNFTHINNVSAISAGDLTYATIEGRKQAYETIEVYRKYVPGMENCYMVSTPNTVGTRESRRIRTEYILTKEDLIRQKEFEDSIGYGSFFIDIHNCSGIGMDSKAFVPPNGFKYQIPFRIIKPVAIRNLLAAGRCAGATHEALGSLRVMPQCGVMGEAAGTAAALSVKKNVMLNALSVKELQDALRNAGGIVQAQDVIEG